MEKDKEQNEEEINESHKSKDVDDTKESNIDEINSEISNFPFDEIMKNNDV